MKRADLLRLHRAHCDGCGACEAAAEAIRDHADEPIDPGQESARADQYERWLGQ